MDGPACPATGPAMGYIAEVQNRFSDDTAIYQQFLNVMMDFLKDPGAKSPFEVQQSVNMLFSGHPDLIEGFGRFIPAETAQQKQDTPQAPGSERQQQITKILAEYNENPTSLGELSGQLKELFGDNPAVLKLLEQYAPGINEGQRKETKAPEKVTSRMSSGHQD
ncbi:hypothetical protein DL98DRAFT_510221 [Cadophora sp. DSE1049]|nr:hypothetical protein DL98DRAFT_510221 [Cadophora sp. DSE1049]